jgi:cytochrome c
MISAYYFHRTRILAAAIALLVALLPRDVSAASSSTPEDVKLMVHAAINYFQENGAEATISRINGGYSFGPRDLYVFMLNPEGMSVANGADSTNLGRDARSIRDIDGKFYGREILERATSEGVWVHYKRMNPVTGKVQPKRSFVREIDGYIIGGGLYSGE